MAQKNSCNSVTEYYYNGACLCLRSKKEKSTYQCLSLKKRSPIAVTVFLFAKKKPPVFGRFFSFIFLAVVSMLGQVGRGKTYLHGNEFPKEGR